MTSHHPSTEGLQAGGRPDAGVELVRSEEQLHVSRHSEVAGRLRISKRVVSEERQVTVTVRREELVVEELPVDAAAAPSEGLLSAGDGTRSTEPVLELWLSEEQVEVTTRVVPRERVRVFVESVTDSVQVSDTVAREVVDVDGAGPL
jgi:uncharacterized protein (TIGR02271 family)